jgi:hypothetical protein
MSVAILLVHVQGNNFGWTKQFSQQDLGKDMKALHVIIFETFLKGQGPML